MSRKRKKRRPSRQAPVPTDAQATSTRTWSFWLFVVVVPVGVAAIALYVSSGSFPFHRNSAPRIDASPQTQSTTPATQTDPDDVTRDSHSGASTTNTEGETAAAEITPAPVLTSSDLTLTDPQQEQALRQEQIDAAVQLVRTYPTDPNALYLLGLIHQEQGSSDEALAQWERCRELNPTRPDLYNSMGQAYVLKGDLDQAVEMLRKALLFQPGLFDARVSLAETLNRQGKMADVVTTLEEALRQGSEPHLSAGQARPHLQEGAPDTRNSINTSETERAYLLLGQAYQQLKQYSKAKQTFVKAAKVYPQSAEAHYGLARVCAALKQPDEAKSHQEKFRQLEAQKQVEGRDVRRDFDPLQVTRQSVAHTHTDVGRVYQRQRDLSRAEQLWRRAAEVDPTDSASRLSLAEMYQRVGKLPEALMLYEELAKIEPTHGVHFFHIANVNLLLKRLDTAEAAYKKTIELEPTRADGYRALAQFYLVSRRKLPEAIPLARKALALNPTAPIYALLGDLYDQTGDLEGALTAMRQATRLDPGNARYQSRYEALQRRK